MIKPQAWEITDSQKIKRAEMVRLTGLEENKLLIDGTVQEYVDALITAVYHAREKDIRNFLFPVGFVGVKDKDKFTNTLRVALKRARDRALKTGETYGLYTAIPEFSTSKFYSYELEKDGTVIQVWEYFIKRGVPDTKTFALKKIPIDISILQLEVQRKGVKALLEERLEELNELINSKLTQTDNTQKQQAAFLRKTLSGHSEEFVRPADDVEVDYTNLNIDFDNF